MEPPSPRPTSASDTLRVLRERATSQHAPGGKLANTLSFTDLYIRVDQPGAAVYLPKQKHRTPSPIQIPEHLMGEVEEIRLLLSQEKTTDAAIIHHGLRLRARIAKLVGDEIWASLRPISPRPWPLQQLNIDAAALTEMAAFGRRDGLILVVGSTGDGKTTTATALLEHWLATEGGVGFTVEDPVEFDLRSSRANGATCWQMEIDDDSGWAEGLKTALRWHPRYVYVGETRTPKAAGQLLRLASTGHTCLTTLHAGSIREGLDGILQLAEADLGASAQARIASCLVGVAHQVMTPDRVPFVNLLITEEGNEGCPFRGCIRDGKLQNIGTYLDQLEIRIFGKRRQVDGRGRPFPENGLDALRRRNLAVDAVQRRADALASRIAEVGRTEDADSPPVRPGPI